MLTSGEAPGERRTVILAVLLYLAIYVGAYVALVAPQYGGSGLVNRLRFDGSFLFAILVAALPAGWLSMAARRPSDAALWIVYLTGYVPAIIVPAFVLGTGWRLMPLWLVVGGGFTLVTIAADSIRVRLPIPKSSVRTYTLMLGAVSIALIAAVLIWIGLPSNPFAVFDVGPVRDDYRDALGDAGAQAGYAVNWASQVVGPMLIAFGWWTRRRGLLAVGVGMLVLIFLLTAFRSLIFTGTLLIAVMVLVLRWRRSFGLVLPTLLSGVIAVTTIGAIVGFGQPASLVIRRLLVVPGQVMAYYYDFFSTGPTFELSHSILASVVTRPYAEAPPVLIGRLYFHDPRVYANGNLWADGMANFGLLGMLGASVLLAVVLVALNAAARQRAASIAIPLVAIAVWRVTNSGILTTILSHGLAVLFLLLWLLPRGRGRTPAGPPKVAHLTAVHRSDDSRIYLKECASLAAAGFDVVLIGRGEAPAAMRQGVRFVSAGDETSRPRRMVLMPLRILRLAWRERADLYHLHDPELIPAGLVLKLLGRSVVYDAHEDLPRQISGKPYLPPLLRPAVAIGAGLLERLAGAAFDGVVTVTDGIAARFPSSKTIVARNWPLASEFGDRAASDYLGRPPVVAFVGRMTEASGALVMADSARLVGTPGAQFVFAGPAAPELARQMVERARPAELAMPGWLDRAGVFELLDRGRVGVVVFQPLPNNIGGYATKLFEYMAAGLPVVASDFPNWRAVLERHDCGLLVDPEDPSAIAAAIDELLADSRRAAAMGARGRKAVLEHYTWEAQGGLAIVQLYDRILAGVDTTTDVVDAPPTQGLARRREPQPADGLPDPPGAAGLQGAQP